MERNPSSPMSSNPDSPDVFGCTSCLHLFSCDTYHSESEDPSYQWCISCGQPKILYLGKLPLLMEEEEQYYLIGDGDGFVLGPFSTQEEAQNQVWTWFNKREAHGKEAQKSRRKGHLRLAAVEGVILEEEDVKEKGAAVKGS